MMRASSGARKDEGKRFARFTMWRGGCGCGNGRRAEATQPSKFDREAPPTVAPSAAKGLREAMRSFLSSRARLPSRGTSAKRFAWIFNHDLIAYLDLLK
jgi:hypothetical protein